MNITTLLLMSAILAPPSFGQLPGQPPPATQPSSFSALPPQLAGPAPAGGIRSSSQPQPIARTPAPQPIAIARTPASQPKLPPSVTGGSFPSASTGTPGQTYLPYRPVQRPAPPERIVPVVTPPPASAMHHLQKDGLPVVTIKVYGNPYDRPVNSFVGQPAGSVPGNPEITDAMSGGWEKVNFSGLGVVDAKTASNKTYIRVPVNQLRQAAILLSKGVTHMFRCDGDVCFVLDNAALNIDK